MKPPLRSRRPLVTTVGRCCRAAPFIGCPDYQGRPPTGKPGSVTGLRLFRLPDGKIQGLTVSMARLGQWQPLGWLPEPAKPGK